MTFAAYIKGKREKMGKTQKDIASALGVSNSAVWCWEVGKNLPRFEDHEKVARFFKMTQEEVTTYLESTLVLGADEIRTQASKAKERTVRIVHATSDYEGSVAIDEAVDLSVNRMAGAGWIIFSAYTTVAVYDRGLSKRTVQWCATLVFER
jgi:transcriptional regulator with XRE-family HTH domain